LTTPSVPRKNAIHEFKIFPTKNAKVAYQPITPGLGWGPTPTAPARLLPAYAQDFSSLNKKKIYPNTLSLSSTRFGRRPPAAAACPHPLLPHKPCTEKKDELFT